MSGFGCMAGVHACMRAYVSGMQNACAANMHAYMRPLHAAECMQESTCAAACMRLSACEQIHAIVGRKQLHP